MLFREGSDAHSFYVLLKGRLQHSTYHSSHKHIIIAPTPEKDEGVCLGTEGLSGGLRRLTTATTLNECTVLRASVAVAPPVSSIAPPASATQAPTFFEACVCEFHKNILTQSCSAQFSWFQEQLASVPKDDWLIVVGHHPAVRSAI